MQNWKRLRGQMRCHSASGTRMIFSGDKSLVRINKPGKYSQAELAVACTAEKEEILIVSE
jgi:hypothetical protein